MRPLGIAACAAGALLCAAAPALADLPPPTLRLEVIKERTAAGQVAVAVAMATNADQEHRITVRAHRGTVSCRRGPLVLPTKTTTDLLYDARTEPRLRWDSLVRFVAPPAAQLTLCGYVVSEGGTRLGQPYVRRSVRVAVRLPRAVPAPPGVRQTCAPAPRVRLVRLDGLRRGTRVCTVARRVFDAWAAAFRTEPNPRDNWGVGWRTSDGKILRISAPRLRLSRLVVPGRAGALMCREAPVGTAQLAPLEVDCEVAAFRFSRR